MQSEQKPDFHDDLITELLYWIEVNLSDRLTMEKASKKTGYSPWYLQRLFKSKTGYALGKYIRDRRLTMAAIALRLTNMPILDISLYYSYDSQQTFTRSFKKNFAETPGMYRLNASWTMNGITAPLTVDEFPQPKYEIVDLPEMAFEGETVVHSYPIEALFNSKNHVHRAELLRYLETPESLLAPVWGLSDCRPDTHDEVANALQMEYTVAHQVKLSDSHTILIPASRYLKINYPYDLSRLNDFILYLYSVFLPTLGLEFIMQPDLEKYSRESALNGVTCEYYIPLAQQ